MFTMIITIIRDIVVEKNEKGVFGVPEWLDNLYTKVWKFWDKVLG